MKNRQPKLPEYNPAKPANQIGEAPPAEKAALKDSQVLMKLIDEYLVEGNEQRKKDILVELQYLKDWPVG